MNKKDFVAQLSENTGLTKKDCDKTLEATLTIISEALKTGEKVQFMGFGSFEVKHRKERTGRNPQTGETFTVAAVDVPVFKAGKMLKDSIAK